MKFSTVLTEYLKLRDDENDQEDRSWEPFESRRVRLQRMKQLELAMDTALSEISDDLVQIS